MLKLITPSGKELAKKVIEFERYYNKQFNQGVDIAEVEESFKKSIISMVDRCHIVDINK